MKINAISTIVGVIIGILVSINYRPTPFIQSISGTTPVYEDKDRQEFVARVVDTFEAGNPYSEDDDAGLFSIAEYNEKYTVHIKRHYLKFNEDLKVLALNNCSTTHIFVKSRYQNDDAKTREFRVFDIDNCKLSK